MPNPTPQPSPEELLLKIYESVEKTRKYILWSRVFSVIKIIIILIPLILAFKFIPSYINKLPPLTTTLSTLQILF